MSITAFGPRAERYARRLPAGVPAFVCEPATAVHALAAAADRRFAGEPFFAAIVMEDQRVRVAGRYGAPLAAQARTYDERRRFFDGIMRQDIGINNVPIGALEPFAAELVKTMHDFVLVADAQLVRSAAERQIVERTLARRRAFVAVYPGLDPAVPAVRSRRGDSIVIWAPDRRADELAVHAFALEERFTRLVVVCAGGALPWSRATIVDAAQGAAELERACVIVDGSDDPGTALALAACGVPLAVSATSGAGEFLDGAPLFEAWQWKSVLGAVSKAMAMDAPRPRTVPDAEMLRATLRLAAPPVVPDPPLVSIVVPSYNRRELLRACLERLSQQIYPHLEIVVVNDAGVDIADVVAAFPRARLVERAENGGVQRALNTGFAEAAGEYLSVCADDDILTCDHVARLVWAMLAAKTKVASSNMILRFRERDAGGSLRTTGFFIQAEGDLDRTELLATNPIQSWMIHRSIVAERGGAVFDPELILLGDYDATLAIGLRHDIAHVDHVTNEGVYTDEGTQLSRSKRSRLPLELQTIYARHPVPGRTDVERMRQASIHAMQVQHVDGAGFRPAMTLPLDSPPG